MIILAVLFLATALLYAMAGFGGGSTYNALLVLYGVDYRVLPAISLACNIIVVTSGVIQFRRAGHLDLKEAGLLCLLSAPAAWIGGRMPVSEDVFITLLAFSLLAAGLFMFVDSPKAARAAGPRSRALPIALGGGLGLLSGIVGIGGGIFLAPVLHLLRWGSAQQIAGAASFFILVNSLFGLAGQTSKLGGAGLLAGLAPFWPLPAAVLVGGTIGGYLGARRLPSGLIKKLTGVLILIVAVRLLAKLFGS